MGNCQKQENVIQTAASKNYGPVFELYLKIYNYVWQNAYQGLFDYQSTKIQEKTLTVKDNCIMSKQKNELSARNDKLALSGQKQIQNSLFHITKKTNYFKIFPIYIEVEQYMLQKLLWLIIRTLPEQKYAISERDIIKFGKQKIKIKELVPAVMHNHSAVIDLKQIKVLKEVYDDLKYQQSLEINENIGSMKKQLGGSNAIIPNSNLNEIQSIVTANEINCRVCLEPGNRTDPLIAPCKCTGSIRYIHLKCLRTWLGKRLNVSKQKCCITLNWQKLSCEMCQEPYKYRIYLDNKKYYTVQIPKPQKPYIVFEVMKKSSDKSAGKIYHFVSLAQKNTVSIGRKKDVDVRISDDISVSRHHATISYDQIKHQFILSDNKSKFGTLVLVKRNLCIRPTMKNIGFQIGTQVYRFESVRGPLIPDGDNKNDVIQDTEQFLNVQDSQDDQIVDENDQNSDDSEGRFQQPHDQDHIEQDNNPNLVDSPVLQRSQTLIETNNNAQNNSANNVESV